jgi:hypothetical protein
MTNNPEHEPGAETELTPEQQAALAGLPDDIASEIADVWKHPDEDTAPESEEDAPDTFPDAWLHEHEDEQEK